MTQRTRTKPDREEPSLPDPEEGHTPEGVPTPDEADPPVEEVPVAPAEPPTEGAEDEPEEEETEASVTVESWATSGDVSIEGRDPALGPPEAALGAFVDRMRADGKGAARPSYYRRRFRQFLREPRD